MDYTNLLGKYSKENKLQYKIRDLNISHIPYEDKLNYINNYFYPPIDFIAQHVEHYRTYTYDWWKAFFSHNLKTITNITFLYTDSRLMPELPGLYICAILCIVRRPLLREIYGRLLCSNCHCGSMLVKYTVKTYHKSPTYHWITLHTLESLVPYYENYGWIKTNYYSATHVDGSIYPYMILPTSPEYTLRYHHIYKLVLYILLNLVCPQETMRLLLPGHKY